MTYAPFGDVSGTKSIELYATNEGVGVKIGANWDLGVPLEY